MLPFKLKITTAIFLFAPFYGASAFWRLPCPRQIGLGRVDPLVAAGAISDHAHTIHGGNSMYKNILLAGLPTSSRRDATRRDVETFCALRSLSRHIDFGINATSDDLLASNCTSCAIDKDHSVYWTPILYFHHSNGTFEKVTQVGGMLVYVDFLFSRDVARASVVSSFVLVGDVN
jgi:hypothetical protein